MLSVIQRTSSPNIFYCACIEHVDAMQYNFTHTHPIPAAHVDEPAYGARVFLRVPTEPDQPGDAPSGVPDHKVDHVAVFACEMLNDDMEVENVVLEAGEAQLSWCLEVASIPSPNY